MATIPTVFPRFRRREVIRLTRVDFPAPGAPVIPTMWARPVCRYRDFRTRTASGISSSRSRISRAAARTFPARISFAAWVIRSVSPDQVPGDDDALHLGGALADLAQLRVPHVPLRGIIAGVPVPAEYLDGLDRSPHGRLGGEQFRHRGLPGVRLPRVLQRRGAPGQELRGGELRSHVGEHPLDRLEFGDGPAELAPFPRVRERLLHRAEADPRGEGGD